MVTLGVEFHLLLLGKYWCLLFEGTLGSGHPVPAMVTLGSW